MLLINTSFLEEKKFKFFNLPPNTFAIFYLGLKSTVILHEFDLFLYVNCRLDRVVYDLFKNTYVDGMLFMPLLSYIS